MVNGFRYLPRQDNNRNGRIRRYELYVSDILNEIKNNDKLIATGAWDDNEMHKDIFFDEPIKAEFFRLVALEDWSGGNFTTAAEIRVFGNVTDELGDTSVTLSVDRNELKKIKIYPNPTKGYMNINNTESGNPFDASVFNLMGKLIKKFSVKNSYKLDVSNFNSGMYFIVFKDSHGNLVETSKIIKQ